MCQSIDEITAEYVVIQELNEFIENGADGKDKLFARVLRRNTITNIQIKQDLQPLASRVKWLVPGKIALVGFLMFMAFYTFVEVVGYSEALMVFK